VEHASGLRRKADETERGRFRLQTIPGYTVSKVLLKTSYSTDGCQVSFSFHRRFLRGGLAYCSCSIYQLAFEDDLHDPAAVDGDIHVAARPTLCASCRSLIKSSHAPYVSSNYAATASYQTLDVDERHRDSPAPNFHGRGICAYAELSQERFVAKVRCCHRG